MFANARLTTALSNYGRHAFKASPAVAVEGNVLGSTTVLDGTTYLRLGAQDKEHRNVYSSSNLLPGESVTPQPSSLNRIDPSVNSHARPVKNVFSGAMMKSPALSTTLLAQPRRRNYSTTAAEQESELPEHMRGALKAPTHAYHKTSDPEVFLEKILKPQGKEGNYDKRQFAYFMLSSSRFFVATGIRLVVLRFLWSWSASAEVLATSKLEVDISEIPRGKTVTITWRGKPVFIRHRTPHEIEESRSTDLSELRDPQTDEERTIDPDWVVLLAICTHLGCVPVTDSGMFGAFFCPCHGSHYDFSGRARKGPAPLNLEVPKHQFVNDGKGLLIG